MTSEYDAIVIGARCGGSPTAMLLARAGYRVLLVDKATFPSDTMSTHLVHPPGVAALERCGILERLQASGCPPITRYTFDFGPVTITGSPRAIDGATTYGPGWALVGDAGYHKHPITAFGITDAFRDAAAAASALDDALTRPTAVRRRARGLPVRAGRRGAPDVWVHVRLRELGTAAGGAAAAARRDAGEPGGDGRLHERHGGHVAGAGVLRARQRRTDHGRRPPGASGVGRLRRSPA
jgi:flavin-dependent dehydrogenase